MKMQIEFVNKKGEWVRTTELAEPIQNLAVGQRISFDHPMLSECLTGTVTKISHVVFLARETSLTYVDVEIN